MRDLKPVLDQLRTALADLNAQAADLDARRRALADGVDALARLTGEKPMAAAGISRKRVGWGTLQQSIVDALQTGPKRWRDLAGSSGASRNSIGQTLRRLCATGVAIKVDTGLYALRTDRTDGDA